MAAFGGEYAAKTVGDCSTAGTYHLLRDSVPFGKKSILEGGDIFVGLCTNLALKDGSNGEVKNITALKNALLAEWDRIPEEMIRPCCATVPDRLRRIFAAKGGHCKNVKTKSPSYYLIKLHIKISAGLLL